MPFVVVVSSSAGAPARPGLELAVSTGMQPDTDPRTRVNQEEVGMLGSNARLFGKRARIVLLVITSSALTLLLVSGPASAGSRGACITLEVEAPILLPDGTVHSPGTLTLCHSRVLSPVSSLHNTYVNGHPVAMLASHKTSSEGGETIEPHALFSRTREGRLELIGYVLPGTGRSVTYHLNESKKPVRRKTRATDLASTSVKEMPETEAFVVMAARTPR